MTNQMTSITRCFLIGPIAAMFCIARKSSDVSCAQPLWMNVHRNANEDRWSYDRGVVVMV